MLSKLFDFDTFYFPKFARIIFIVLVVLVAIGTVIGFFAALFGPSWYGFGQKLLQALLTLLGGAVTILLMRLSFEFSLVVFSINENIKAMRENSEKTG